jgi:hypothetical protein
MKRRDFETHVMFKPQDMEKDIREMSSTKTVYRSKLDYLMQHRGVLKKNSKIFDTKKKATVME